MTSSKPTSWGRKNLIPILIVLTICYQLVYNILLMSVVERDAGQDECSAVPGVGNADSPHCQEVRLFRSWHEAAEEDAGLLQSTGAFSAALSDEVEASSDVPIAVELSTHVTALLSTHVTEFGAQVSTEGTPPLLEPREGENQSNTEPVQNRQEVMDQLENKVSASLSTGSNMSPWAEDLHALHSRLESEQASLGADQAVQHTESAVEAYAQAFEISMNSSSATSWARDFVALQKRLGVEPNASRAAEFSHDMSQRMTDLEEHLAHLASERKKWEADLLRKYGAPAASTTTAPSSFLAKRLQWSLVKAWSKTSWRPQRSWSLPTSDKTSVVLRRDLRHLHWSGQIPKVACITAIQGSTHTRARMMYFINNFRLQDYEGPRQLVLVYEYTDAEAAELVKKYVDNSFIKAVATRGGVEFPSTTALRYGAWSSDADVVARWDFDEWHDPSRLSMQIRAMATTSRPACMIKHPHGVDENNEGSNAPITSSLAGERSWMDQHWRPYLEGGQTLEPANLVQLDMQNDALVSSISHFKQEANEQLPEVKTDLFQQDDEQKAEVTHGWNMTQCLEFDNSNKLTADERHLEKTVAENVGYEMRGQFHKLMMKRHDITQKLQLLCMESMVEFNAKKQAFMWQHVDQMVEIRTELDKHIAGMKELFGLALS